MAIFHLTMKAISRGSGRSATGAAAYRSGELILDERTGIVFDFTHKQGVEHAELILPGGATGDRAQFWNQVELHHKRGDAVLVREVEVSLPNELNAGDRLALALAYGRELADRYQVAADVAVHAPSRHGDHRNHHAHIMLSACSVDAEGNLGKKVVELDPIHCQRHRLDNAADRERSRWATLANSELERAGHSEHRIDHRTLEAQGIQREPTHHLGPAVSAMVRDGRPSQVIERIQEQAHERLYQARLAGELERELRQLEKALVDTSVDMAAAMRERDAARAVGGIAQAGMAEFRAEFERHKRVEFEKAEALRAFEAFKAEYQAKQQLELDRIEAHKAEAAMRRQELERGTKKDLSHQAKEHVRGRGGYER